MSNFVRTTEDMCRDFRAELNQAACSSSDYYLVQLYAAFLTFGFACQIAIFIAFYVAFCIPTTALARLFGIK
ncbi:hypothetical protein VPFG_00094 [Vibrio phage nt-1]|uniref:Uncharacterized protein n=1 Tax=Vibrio phage nt-1 TaxID=115992 RepID=R9TEC6_9CAUD|nr:hypothetical protein VPFG_00094 [Vibrio phage nt-1]AGN30096.2 hypothetical protein VPFG_00094 [Vibrio phage nt-1]